ncbi:MFS transporter [Amycolatopsis sp. WAC 01416]|uniref:MFS transporter n=1 Tax=Amycolatopsis sp. WAC 01416 TaxID=2203196 RepID=UPI000F7ABC19|nr:MFS transporter [Amycolatopsis sp. WAC 01416]RSN34643.1 MFS transporter [Amycolatopsis sp. WAC 01416]
MTTRETEQRKKGWPAVRSLAGATFTVVTSEMLPVGLLTPISRDLQVTEGMAGLTLMVTGLVAAVSGPLLIPALGNLDRRAVLCALMALLAVGNLLAAWSPGFGVMLVARVLVGIGMGGVWAIAASLAVRLVPPRSIASATSLVFSGIAVASVLGVPAGTYLGELVGWRMAFVGAGGLSLVVLAALAISLPSLPTEGAVRLGAMLRLAGVPRVRLGLIVVALIVTGHFAAYTYVRPVLEKVSGVSAGQIGTLLLVYGLFGVAGNFASGTGAARSPRVTLLVLGGTLAATMALVPILGLTTPAAAALLVVWGLAYGGVSVASQSWMLVAAPDAREATSALFTGVFNAAIAAGALVGGLATDAAGTTAVMWLGGVFAAGAVLVLATAGGRSA